MNTQLRNVLIRVAMTEMTSGTFGRPDLPERRADGLGQPHRQEEPGDDPQVLGAAQDDLVARGVADGHHADMSCPGMIWQRPCTARKPGGVMMALKR